ncbi:MAG: hypothetical protein AB9903_16665 [Vulcanimicrobiota bacterium]
MKRWKTLKDESLSEYGEMQLKIGVWYHDNDINRGFCCSRNIVDFMYREKPGIVARAEVKGEQRIIPDFVKDGYLITPGLEVWSDIRILQAWQWTKFDYVAIAAYAAGSVVDVYEKKYPHDDRPRKAVEAVKKWLKDSSSDAAIHAIFNAAKAVSDASYAAHHAPRAYDHAYPGGAASAANAAWCAARAAAYAAGGDTCAYVSTEVANNGPISALRASADAASLKQRIDRWVMRRLKQKGEM